jgi:type IV pilus assembly protein PilP
LNVKKIQMLKTAALIAVLGTAPAVMSAQAAGAKPSAPPAAAPVPAAATKPASGPPAEPYSYNPEGRRDPFVSLVSRGGQPSATGKRTDGLGGLATADLMMSGVLQSRGAFIALVKTPEGKTLTAHVNDRLADGTIRSITPQGMVIMQEVNDPLSLVKVKEVRKGLRASDDVKQ